VSDGDIMRQEKSPSVAAPGRILTRAGVALQLEVGRGS
jgi:hypothetical protein